MRFRQNSWAMMLLGCMLLLLAACSSTDKGAAETPVEQTQSEQGGQQSEQKETSSTEAEASGQTREFVDALDRTVEIPVKPQRPLALSNLGDLLLLGVKPIGSTPILMKFFDEQELAGVENVGDSGNLEKILSLEPDLIFASAGMGKEEIEALEKVAPVVTTPFFGEAFATLSIVADAMGLQEEEAAFLQAFDDKVAETRAKLSGEIVEGEQALVIQFAQKTIYTYPTSIFPTIYRDLGFVRSPYHIEVEKQTGFAPTVLSEETLGDFEADRIFVIINDEDSRSTWEDVEQGAVWKQLPAVQAGQTYVVGQRLSISDASTLYWALDELSNLMLADKK